MPSTTRKLRLLRINDNIQNFLDPRLEDDWGGLLSTFLIPHPDRPDQAIRRIAGTVSSQLAWQSQALPSSPPDLLTVDINFGSDADSPLLRPEALAPDGLKVIPTGLLHALPFLAWARTSRRPCAVAFHTGDKPLFFAQRDDEGAPSVMKLLAAELAGLAGAVSGTLHGTTVRNADRAPAAAWVQERTSGNESDAVCAAVALYRRRLWELGRPEGISKEGAILIDPTAYVRLLEYATRAAAEDRQIHPDEEGWPGLGLVYPDGCREEISIASLFADVDPARGLRSEDFREDAPANPDKPWMLVRGCPPVLPFLLALRGWAAVFERASQVVASLPTGDELHPISLNKAVSNHEPDAGVTRLAAAVMQVVRRHHAGWAQWQYQYSRQEWHPLDQAFGDGLPLDQRIPDALGCLLGAAVEGLNSTLFPKSRSGEAASATGDPLGPELAPAWMQRIRRHWRISNDVKEKTIQDAFKFHFELVESLGLAIRIETNSQGESITLWNIRVDRLEQLNLLSRTKSGTFVLDLAAATSWLANTLPPYPAALGSTPRAVAETNENTESASGEENGQAADSARNGMTQLHHNLGFKDYNQLKRIFSDVDKTASPADWLVDAHAPVWVKELGRQFAQVQCKWDDERFWPGLLR